MMQHATAKRSSPALGLVRTVVNEPGESLPRTVRAPLEKRFGHSLDRIRIHTDPLASLSARALQANAYTVGRDVVFDAGRYEPTSTVGRRLLTHEIAHAIQQDQRRSDPVRLGEPHDRAEADARDAASDATHAPRAGLTVPPGTVQCQPGDAGGTHEAQKTLPPPPPVVVPLPAAGDATAHTKAPIEPTTSNTPNTTTGDDDYVRKTKQGASVKGPADDKPHIGPEGSKVTTTDVSTKPYTRSLDFSLMLTYEDFHVASPLVLKKHLDILHEPNVFATFSYNEPPAGVNQPLTGSLRNSLFGVSASLLNYHLVTRHEKDLAELSFDAALGVQTGSGGNAVVGQFGPTLTLSSDYLSGLFGGAETQLIVNASGSYTLPFGKLPPGAPPPPTGFQFGTISVGLKVKFGGGKAKGR